MFPVGKKVLLQWIDRITLHTVKLLTWELHYWNLTIWSAPLQSGLCVALGFVGSACKLLWFGLYRAHISITLIGAETPDTDNKGLQWKKESLRVWLGKPEMQTQIATSSPRALLPGKALAPAHQICINAAISPPATTVTGDSKCWGTDREAQQKWQNRDRGSLEKRRGLKEWAYTCR